MLPKGGGREEESASNQRAVIRELTEYIICGFDIKCEARPTEAEIAAALGALRSILNKHGICLRATVMVILEHAREPLLDSLVSGSGSFRRLTSLFDSLTNFDF